MRVPGVINVIERAKLLMTWAQVTHPEDLAADVVASFNRALAGKLDGYGIDSRWVAGSVRR